MLEAMDYAQAVPSLSQAQRIKKLSKENQLTLEKMQEIMSEIKKVRSRELLLQMSSFTNISQADTHPP